MTGHIEDISLDFEIIKDLSYLDGDNEPREIELLESKYDCQIYIDVEKFGDLQYEFTYEVDFELVGFPILKVKIESGINNGTVVLDFEWI